MAYGALVSPRGPTTVCRKNHENVKPGLDGHGRVHSSSGNTPIFVVSGIAAFISGERDSARSEPPC